VKYNEWAKISNFDSKLLKAVKMKKEKADNAAAKIKQRLLDGHLKEIPLKEQVVGYTDSIFQEAAIEWLIATDQVHRLLFCVEVLFVCLYLLMDIELIQAFEHPSFKKMIDIAACATNGVVIPTRKATCDEIINISKHSLQSSKHD
jgi:hypothetical protein